VALLAQVLEEMKDKVRVTPVVIEVAARYLKIRFVKKIFVTLLDIWAEGGNTITETILVAAASNVDWSIEVMKLLLDRKGETDITEAILLAAAGSPRDKMKILLDYKGDKTEITEALLVAAAGNIYGETTPLWSLLSDVGTKKKRSTMAAHNSIKKHATSF
jgi:hypothetical protein